MENIKVEQKIYSEVYGVLNKLGEEYINKIPDIVFNNIKRDIDINYIPVYNLKISLVKQGISKEALAMIYILHYRYWYSSDKKKMV